jgi:hypothetical protein
MKIVTAMSSLEVFESACMKDFSYLSDYGFSLVKTEKDNSGCFLTYKNKSLALKISLDRDGIEIVFFKLSNNEIPPYPIFFDPSEEFLVFNANDLLFAKCQKHFEQVTKRLYEESYLKAKVKEFAELLRLYASDVLLGNFEVLGKIKELVVRRSHELKHEQ